MNGTDNTTGKHLSGINHLRQSIQDILTTPLGTRVMRRDYGSRLYQLVDAPLNSSTLLNLYVATAEALRNWEPRFELQQVVATSAEPGKIELSLTGRYVPEGVVVTLDGLEVA